MKKRIKKPEAGVALIMALLALLVLSAIAAGLVYMTNTETMVNSNYRSEQVAYFAAKAGMEEARDRMMLNQPGGYYFANMVPNPLPTKAPTDSNGGVLYIVNEGNRPGTVQPWIAGNAYMDDEICHDSYALTGVPSGSSVPDPDVHCTSGQLPTGSAWYQSTTSQLPYNGTAAALPFKWVRVSLKLNGSVQNYMVNDKAPATASVCWNGATEVALTAANCAAMSPPATPVYLVTSLAVSQTLSSTSGARKLVQAEVAMNPTSSFAYGLFGTGTGCGDVAFTGNGHTDSFDGSKGPYGSSNSGNTGGDIGSNGNVSLGGNASIGGSVGVLPVGGSVAAGPCPGSNYTISGGNAGLVSNPNNVVTPLTSPVVFPVPPAPVPPPPTNNVNYTSTTNLVPGSYGNITLSGKAALVLAPGVYNVNSLNLAGQSSIEITPVGQVVLNIAGNGVAGNVLDLSGNSVNNQTLNANQFQINYGGTGAINVTGNASTSYFILNAPKAPVTIAGNGDIFGAVLGATIQDVGNGGFHYDKSANLAPASSGALQLISFRHIPY
ncbi:MAG TPA: PilX N-terminal domain-containing pilus assembly protein [Verrucomicrobiae bacterium]|nr:PilX N-terminal domain-containing pilus assembly protein [Verrucomicrobiae bacterium]